MAMTAKATDPVFVIHGAGERSGPDFRRRVRTLETAVNRVAAPRTFRFVPVFWGDLQPEFLGIEDTIPSIPAAVAPAGQPGVGVGVRLPGKIGRFLDRLFTKRPLEDWAERATVEIRRAALPPTSTALGDVFTYVSSRIEIQRRLRAVIAEAGDGLGAPDRPISIIGHSLGGVIAFDGACSTAPQLHVRHLVTFGSQSAVLHVLDPRQLVVLPPVSAVALPPYQPGKPVMLPGSLLSWLNIWHAMDPLAFLAANVFRLDGGSVRDARIEGQEPSWSEAHSTYWTHTAVPILIAEELDRDPAAG
jgi:pimeloyl-ACP methyl ester carboxylesterase